MNRVTITQHDVWQAQERIGPLVPDSPLMFSESLSSKLDRPIYLKLEQWLPTHSFKIRGAANKLLALTDEEQERGVVTFSTGNFGRSVAYIAKQLGIHAVICISNRVPASKVAAFEEMDATVEIVGTTQDDAEAHCYELEKTDGLTVIHPFDDPLVIAGHGTIGLEVLSALPQVDTVVAGLSGGGLLSGIGTAMKSADTGINLTGVSTEKGAAMHASIQQGYPVTVDEGDTLADSLLGGIGLDNQYTFELIQHYVDRIVLADEEMIASGMDYLFRHEKMVTEGAAAAGTGALLHQKADPGNQTVLVVSGSNADPETLVDIHRKNV